MRHSGRASSGRAHPRRGLLPAGGGAEARGRVHGRTVAARAGGCQSGNGRADADRTAPSMLGAGGPERDAGTPTGPERGGRRPERCWRRPAASDGRARPLRRSSIAPDPHHRALEPPRDPLAELERIVQPGRAVPVGRVRDGGRTGARRPGDELQRPLHRVRPGDAPDRAVRRARDVHPARRGECRGLRVGRRDEPDPPRLPPDEPAPPGRTSSRAGPTIRRAWSGRSASTGRAAPSRTGS